MISGRSETIKRFAAALAIRACLTPDVAAGIARTRRSFQVFAGWSVPAPRRRMVTRS